MVGMDKEWVSELAEGDEVIVGHHAFPEIRGLRRIARVTPTGRIKTISGYAFALERISHDVFDSNGCERGGDRRAAGPLYLYQYDGPEVHDDLRDVDIARILTWCYCNKAQRAVRLYRAVRGCDHDEAVKSIQAMSGRLYQFMM